MATEALMALMAALVGSQVFIVRSLITRSDRVAVASAKHISQLIERLGKAIDSFETFEKSENEVHEKIITHQERLADALERIESKLSQ